MILVGIDLFELKVRMMFFDCLNSGKNEGLNAVIDDLASIFGRKHNVVVAIEYAV